MDLPKSDYGEMSASSLADCKLVAKLVLALSWRVRPADRLSKGPKPRALPYRRQWPRSRRQEQRERRIPHVGKRLPAPMGTVGDWPTALAQPRQVGPPSNGGKIYWQPGKAASANAFQKTSQVTSAVRRAKFHHSLRRAMTLREHVQSKCAFRAGLGGP
uniref:Uncharacterized protein n=1 Tax=Trichuris muris TaxID=70415 RepID=A0A5S6QCF7_TRIMR